MNPSKKKTKKKDQQEELPVNKIIQQCEQTLGILFIILEITQSEQEELKRMFAIVQDKMHLVEQKIQTLEKEERLLRRDNDEWEYFIKEKRMILGQLKQLTELLDGKDHSFEIDITTHPCYKEIQNYQPLKKQMGQDLMKSIYHEETLIVKLENQLNEIQEETKLLRQSGAFWNCVRCGITLKEGTNEESCVFHPGKLKYFSCRTCGGDEYFTCCNQCRDCNPGCKKGLHKP